MDNKDIATSILTIEKSMIKDYTVALSEASNEEFSNKIKELFDMALRAHRDLFSLMLNKGWYKLEQADKEKISEEYSKLSNEMSKKNE